MCWNTCVAKSLKQRRSLYFGTENANVSVLWTTLQEPKFYVDSEFDCKFVQVTTSYSQTTCNTGRRLWENVVRFSEPNRYSFVYKTLNRISYVGIDYLGRVMCTFTNCFRNFFFENMRMMKFRYDFFFFFEPLIWIACSLVVGLSMVVAIFHDVWIFRCLCLLVLHIFLCKIESHRVCCIVVVFRLYVSHCFCIFCCHRHHWLHCDFLVRAKNIWCN